MTITRYVSTTGNDSASGESAAAAWATVAHAKAAVRALIAANPGESIVVELATGRHEITATLAFTADDSPAHPATVTWRSTQGGKAAISGGTEVTGTWTLHDAGKKIWVIDYAGSEFRQLWIDGVRCRRARRNSGLTGSPTATADGFTTDDAVTTYGNLTDVELLYRQNWRESRNKIASAVASTSITMSDPVQDQVVAMQAYFGTRFPQFIENAYEILYANASAGTFYWDRTAGKIYLIPPAGMTDPNDFEVLVPMVTSLATFDGAARLNFTGLTWRHGTWLPENNGFGDIQSMVLMEEAVAEFDTLDPHGRGRVIPAGIDLWRSSRISFTSSEFNQMGIHAIAVQDGCDAIDITGNVFHDVSGHGVLVGRPSAMVLGTVPRRVNVLDNLIFDCGVEYPSGVPICHIHGRDCKIERNEVGRVPYTGIATGWGWGNVKHHNVFPNIGNSVKGNYIHDTVQALDDGGPYYNVGQAAGLVVTGNYVRNNREFGFYFDQGSQGVTFRDNVVEATEEWFKSNAAFGNSTVGDNHSDTTVYTVNAPPSPGSGPNAPPAGLTPWEYAAPITYDPAAPTAAQQAIIDAAGPSVLPFYVPNSNYLGWTEENLGLVRDADPGPDGLMLGWKATISTSNANHRIYQGVTSTKDARKIYAKAGTAAFVALTNTGVADSIATFDLASGTVYSVFGGTAKITPVGSDGWYLCEFQPNTNGTWCQVWFGESAAQAGGLAAFVGTNKTVFFAGAMIGNLTLL